MFTLKDIGLPLGVTVAFSTVNVGQQTSYHTFNSVEEARMFREQGINTLGTRARPLSELISVLEEENEEKLTG